MQEELVSVPLNAARIRRCFTHMFVAFASLLFNFIHLLYRQYSLQDPRISTTVRSGTFSLIISLSSLLHVTMMRSLPDCFRKSRMRFSLLLQSMPQLFSSCLARKHSSLPWFRIPVSVTPFHHYSSLSLSYSLRVHFTRIGHPAGGSQCPVPSGHPITVLILF